MRTSLKHPGQGQTPRRASQMSTVPQPWQPSHFPLFWTVSFRTPLWFPPFFSILGTPVGSSSSLAFPMCRTEIQLIMASPPCRENSLRAAALEGRWGGPDSCSCFSYPALVEIEVAQKPTTSKPFLLPPCVDGALILGECRYLSNIMRQDRAGPEPFPPFHSQYNVLFTVPD